MSTVINRVVGEAAKKLSNSLMSFYPAHGANGFNERNLTYQLARAFEARSNAHAFMEVPFKNSLTGRQSYRVDCMLFDKDRIIFIECKRLYSVEKTNELRADFARLNAENLTPLLGKFTASIPRPRKVYRMIVAEAWQRKNKAGIVDWWKGETSPHDWDHAWIPDNRNAIEVMTFKNGNTLHWLYAYEEMELGV